MRSSITAGLTPQQLLDRRRAQNKLAQRRFREKARMSRFSGTSPSSYSIMNDTAATLPAVPAHLDVDAANSLPLGSSTSRGRSASSDSSSTSASSSLSSQLLSPGSSCTELSTPTMPSFNSKAMRPTEPAIVSNLSAPPIFAMDDITSENLMTDATFCMTSAPLSGVYASFGSSFPRDPLAMPPSQPLTYSGLAGSSNSLRNIGLKMVGLHADPFLMSQSLPSPALPGSRSSALPTDTLFGPLFEPRFAQESQSQCSASFENLLRINPQPSMRSSTSAEVDIGEPVLSPSSGSLKPFRSTDEPEVASLSLLADGAHVSLDTEASQSASLHLDQAIAKHVHTVGSRGSAQSITIASRPFALVVELIGSRFGLTGSGQDLPQLLSRLQLHGNLDAQTETSKGLVFDAAINWDTMGTNMLPTTEQLLYPHRAFIDTCLPWPAVRTRLLKHALTNPVCEEEFALDLLLSILSSDEALSSARVYGDDVLDPEAWELSERMWAKWWGLFDDSVVRRTNWWRRQRGLGDLVYPPSTYTGNDSVRQGLGTGSLAEVHRLVTTLLP
ncbi:hypothetical protein PHBOTO_006320 [Pseudozyma hubeiensis]|nr:hypothetical protein PHBOTO_006320 [Pseudozyma hubeiensis]